MKKPAPNQIGAGLNIDGVLLRSEAREAGFLHLAFDGFDEFVVGCLAASGALPCELAVGSDDEERGDAADAVVACGGVGVQQEGVVEALFLHVADGITAALAGVHTDDDDAAIFVFLVHFLHPGHDFSAWAAPGCPEIEDDDLAPVVSERMGLALRVLECPTFEFSAESGGGVVHRLGVVVSGVGAGGRGDRGDTGDQAEREDGDHGEFVSSVHWSGSPGGWFGVLCIGQTDGGLIVFPGGGWIGGFVGQFRDVTGRNWLTYNLGCGISRCTAGLGRLVGFNVEHDIPALGGPSYFLFPWRASMTKSKKSASAKCTSRQFRQRRKWRRIRERIGIAMSFAAMTCLPMSVLAASPPTPPDYPWTDEEWDAYMELVLAEAMVIPSAPDFYASQADQDVLVQEFMQPDLNGDGLGDMVIPTINLGATDPSFGRVGVISGWFGDQGLLLDIVSDESGDSFGIATVGIPDIDGDQVDDLAVGAPTSNLGAQSGGRVDVYSGASGDLILRIVGNETDGKLGLSIASAGDCNGDGVNDIIVGEPHSDTARGRAFVYYGADGLGNAGTVERTPADADLSLTDGLAEAQFGLSVAGVGDLDADGVPDLAVGSPNRSEIDPDSVDNGMIERLGAVNVFSGSTGARLFTINGTAANSLFGHTMLGNNDIDGDGLVDLLISAPGFVVEDAGAQPVAPSTDGRVYVLSSTAIAQLPPGATIGSDEIALQLTKPAGSEFQFGVQVNPAHDVDGDGVDDILVHSMTPVELQLADLPAGIDLGGLGLPAGAPIFTVTMRTHMYSGADGSLLYSFDSSEGSGVEIKVTYPGPAAAEEVSQLAPTGDVTQDGVVDVSDLSETVLSVGQPATVSPNTDVNQDGVTEVTDVEIINDIIVAQGYLDPIEHCTILLAQQEQHGAPPIGPEYDDLCDCLGDLYGGLDIDGVAIDTGDLDCTGDDDPGPPTTDGGGGGPDCNADFPLPDFGEDCTEYAQGKAACEFDDAKAALDAEQAQINADKAMAQSTFDQALIDATTKLRDAHDLALTVANIATERGTRKLSLNYLLRSEILLLGGAGAAGTGALVASSNPVSGAVVIVIGGVAFIVFWLDTNDYVDTLELTHEQMLATVFGLPNAYTSAPNIGGAILDPDLWHLVQLNAQNWADATQTYRNETLAARVVLEAALLEITMRQDDLDERKQECMDEQEAREDELLAECIDGPPAP